MQHKEQHTALWEDGGGNGAAQQTPHTPGVTMTVKPQRHTYTHLGERGSRVLVQRGGDALFTALSTGVSHVRCVTLYTHTSKGRATHRVRDSPEGGEGCVGVGCGGQHLCSGREVPLQAPQSHRDGMEWDGMGV